MKKIAIILILLSAVSCDFISLASVYENIAKDTIEKLKNSVEEDLKSDACGQALLIKEVYKRAKNIKEYDKWKVDVKYWCGSRLHN